MLRQHSCPYYELAESDPAICALERKMFEKVLGRSLRLSQCRLDGDRFCDFQAKPIPTAHPSRLKHTDDRNVPRQTGNRFENALATRTTSFRDN